MAQNQRASTPAHFFGELRGALDHGPYVASVLCPKLGDLRGRRIAETPRACDPRVQRSHHVPIRGRVRYLRHAPSDVGWEVRRVNLPHRFAEGDPICPRQRAFKAVLSLEEWIQHPVEAMRIDPWLARRGG